MNNNFLRQLCYTIEQEYWKRYLDDYADYGDSSSMTRKRWEDWQVADDITKQILNSIAISPDWEEEPWKKLCDLVKQVNIDELVGLISQDRLNAWSAAWREEVFDTLEEMKESVEKK